MILEKQLTGKANARSGELRHPIAVGGHLAWPAEAARAQVGRRAQAKGIVGLITLPVDLIMLTPVQKSAFSQGTHKKGKRIPQSVHGLMAFHVMSTVQAGIQEC